MTNPPNPQTDHTAVWVDGDPLMEAIASAVWERCRTEHPSSVVDDPRNIAAVAAAVARAHAASAPSAPTRAAVLREAANVVRSMDSDYALQEAAEHLDGLAVEDDEEREAQAHLDALAPLAEGAPLPALDGPALYEHLVSMFSGPLPWPPDSRPDLVTLRARIAEDLYAHDHPGWRVPLRESDVEPVYRERAVAVLTGLRHIADEEQQPETPDAGDPCSGFPDDCPNLRPVLPDPPHHDGGIRCGCGDEEPRS